MDQHKWDCRFLDLAAYVAAWSRDPSSKVGAVVTRGKRIVSLGYNGFPQGVDDDPARYLDRDLKYKLVVHAERNALLFAGQDLHGCTLYTWPFAPCPACAGMVIQAGITRVVAPPVPADKIERWGADLALSSGMFAEAGVELVLLGV